MAIDKLVNSTELDSGLTTIADAIRTKGGTSALLAFPDGMAQAVADIPSGGITPTGNINITENGTYDVTQYASANVNVSGGTEITDGIVVKARDANGYATKVDLYAADGVVKPYQFYAGSEDSPAFGCWSYLTDISVKTPITEVKKFGFGARSLGQNFDFSTLVTIRDSAFKKTTSALAVSLPACTVLEGKAFANSAITSLDAPLISSVNNSLCYYCTNLATVSFPRASVIGSYTAQCFRNCTALTSAQFGSIGYAVSSARPDVFTGCTQNFLTITAYCKGTYADTLLANIRNGATNATIIIKASEDTTYGGTSYAAGDTMITSTP